MTTENQQPEATQATTTQPASTTPSNDVTLEQVYRDFDVRLPVQEQPQQPQYQPPQPSAPEPQRTLNVPDPSQDPDGFRNWLVERQRMESVLASSVQQVHGLVAQMTQAQKQTELRRDITSAVDKVNEHVKLPDQQKKLIEFALEDKARSDPRFLQVWENRHRNPIAYERALVAVSREIGDVFSVRVDPQLRADREALRASQTGSAVARDTPGPEIPAAALAPAGSAEFDRWWQAQARTYQ